MWSLWEQVGTLQGKFVDATPFQKCSTEDGDGGKGGRRSGREETTVDKYGKQLKEYGFNYHGTEVMYSGVLGTELTCEIYLGVVYYQRLRHMVSDKFQVSSVRNLQLYPRPHSLKNRSLVGIYFFANFSSI